MSPARNPEDRRAIARIAAYSKHATVDGREATRAARHAFLETRFEREVDPEGRLPVDERRRRASAARKAYFHRLALRSAQVRRTRAARRR